MQKISSPNWSTNKWVLWKDSKPLIALDEFWIYCNGWNLFGCLLFLSLWMQRRCSTKYMNEVLHTFGFSGYVANSICALHSIPSARVYNPSLFSDPFTLPNGTRQGCSRAPRNLYISKLLNSWNSRSHGQEDWQFPKWSFWYYTILELAINHFICGRKRPRIQELHPLQTQICGWHGYPQY